MNLSRLTDVLAGRYRIERELGEGGMATVYLALDLKHDRQVAIKVMRPELAESLGGERFLREIRIAAQLSHPHIVGLLDSGQVGDGNEALLYYVMPFIAGETLRSRLNREGALAVKPCVRLLCELADALVKAHASGIIHRDIKPDNIFIADGHAALADFGIARALSVGRQGGKTPPGGTMATALGVSVGTPTYMAPEQAAADPATDHRADVYSLGVVAYEMLTGKPPFEGPSPHQLIVAHLTQAPEPIDQRRPGLPLALSAIIMQCLSKDPAQRFATAKELLDALEAVPLGETNPGAVPATPFVPTLPALRALRTLRALRALLALAVVASLAVAAWYVLRPRPTQSVDDAIAPQSLAVLPLTNLSGDSADDYFSDGISEEILTAVSRIPGLRVAARTSSFALRGSNLAVGDIGQRLKVRHVLDGSVQRAGGRVRVRVRLTDAETGFQLWSEKYDKQEGDVFVLEDEVADAIASALTQQLGSVAVPALAGATTDAAAHDAYLRGRQAMRSRAGADDLKRAIAQFDQAIQRDPRYARAWAGLGSAWVLLPEYGGASVAEAEGKAEPAVRRALELDSASAEAYAALGYLRKSYRYDWSGAETAYRRALTIDLNDATTHQWLGELLATTGRMGEARQQFETAVARDPESPVPHLALGSHALAQQRRDIAETEFARALAIEPRFWPVLLQQAWLHMLAGDTTAAKKTAERAARALGDDPAPYLQLVRASADPSVRPAALLILKLWSEIGRPLFVVASWYAALGDHDRAIKTLDEVVRRHDPYASYTPWWPFFETARADPRWQELLRQLKIAAPPA